MHLALGHTFSSVQIVPFFLSGYADALSPFAGPLGIALCQAFLHVNAQGPGLAMVFVGFYTLLSGCSSSGPRSYPAGCVVAGLGWLTFLWLPLGLRYAGVITLIALAGAAAKIGWFLIVGVNEDQWLAEERREAASVWA